MGGVTQPFDGNFVEVGARYHKRFSKAIHTHIEYPKALVLHLHNSNTINLVTKYYL